MPGLTHLKGWAALGVFFGTLLGSCPAAMRGNPDAPWKDFYEAKKGDAAVLAASLSPAARYAQLFLVDLSGSSDYAPEDADGEEILPGGYLFFSTNIAGTPEAVKEFTRSIHRSAVSRGRLPPFLAIDHEGGAVNRLRGILDLDAAAEIAKTRSVSEAESLYAEQGAALSKLGFHLNLAPVLDGLTAENEVFLGSRSYGDAKAAERYGRAAIRGFRAGGIHCAAKHFPVGITPGVGRLEAGPEVLDKVYLAPWRSVLSRGEDPAAVLVAHAVTAGEDAPASLSRHWVTEVLRGEFGYTGLVITDDLSLKALETQGFPPRKAVVAAIDAGVDCILLRAPAFSKAVQQVADRAGVDAEFRAKVQEAVVREIVFKMYAGLL